LPQSVLQKMYQIKINDRNSFELDLTENGPAIDGNVLNWDMKPLPDGTFSIISENNSYVAAVEHIDRENKTIKIKLNQQVYTAAITEPIDQLLAKMGINNSAEKKARVIKAPMPGMILKILVSPGQQLKKDDPLLILEAMKMENVFKAPADAVVKAIRAEEHKAVEKGEILIELE